MSARYEPTLTTVCRTDRHRHCTGCDCRCHHVPPPVGFRELVRSERLIRTLATDGADTEEDK